MASPLSRPLTVGAAGFTAARGCEEGRGPVGAEVIGAAEARGGAAWPVEDGGGAPTELGGGAATDGPPGGSVGSLIVGAAEGLGGKLMRTVSFLG